MPSVTAVIEDVTAKQTSTGKTMYSVVIDGKKITTFDLPVAEKAKALKGQKATVEFVEKQNGEFLNRNVTGITGAAPVAAAFTVEPGKDEQIARAVALKAAVDFQGGKGSVLDVKLAADEFLAWLQGAPVGQPAAAVDESDGIPF